MGFIEFTDKGFEKVVREKLQLSERQLTAEDLLLFNGVLIADGYSDFIEIPWHSDSSAFQMTFPNLMFNAADSENGQWEPDLVHFSHIQALHLYVATENLKILKDFKNLRELYVKSSKTADWKFLRGLPCLSFLYLRECEFDDLTPIRELCQKQEGLPKSNEFWQQQMHPQGLTHLRLNYCGISDISPLAKCKHIEDLNLSHNDITDISPLKGISSLYYLTLRYNKVSDITPLKDLRFIYYLNLRHNQISDISALKDFKNNLRRLYLGYNEIEDYSPAYKLRLVDQDIEGYKEHYYKVKGWVNGKED